MGGPEDVLFGRSDIETADPAGACCELTLFVSGATDLSVRAIENARALGDIHLAGRYNLSVIDVHDDAAAVASSGVLVTPTLVKTWPPPVRRFVGDLSHADRVLLALDIPHVPD